MKFKTGSAASTTISAGTKIEGDIVSTTVIVCSYVVLLPLLSIDVQVTTVEPNEKTSGALLVMEEIPVMSLASASPISTSVSSMLVASTI